MTAPTRPARSDRTARMIAAGLDRAMAAIHAVPVTSVGAGPRTLAARYERLAQLYARRARWWAVLERASITDPTLPTVYVRAVVLARLTDIGHANDWARHATEMAEHARATETRRSTAADVADVPALVRGVSA